jgi:hypothetical protein
VSTVATDPVTSTDPGSALTWSYSYSADQLTKVCPPTSSTSCTGYGYTTVSQYANVAQNAAPHSYWRLGDAASGTAGDAALANENTDAGAYHNVSASASALPGSTAQSASLDGVSSFVDLKSNLVNSTDYQTVSLWFKTTVANGVLFSYQADPITNGTTAANYTPALYVGSDGKLLGEFWTGDTSVIQSAQPVTDGKWHHVVLAGAGITQSMYLDGQLVGTKAGTIQLFGSGGASHVYAGAGFIGNGWPDEPHFGVNTGYATYFNGSISDVAFYDHWVPASTVAGMYGAGHGAAKVLSGVT